MKKGTSFYFSTFEFRSTMTKAIILDLDNTIYPVQSIGDALFAGLFALIEVSGEVDDRINEVKREIMRRPFQLVAREFDFSDDLTAAGFNLLKNLEYVGPISPFPDYSLVRKMELKKFLVTTGFVKLQESKIRGMQIGKDFEKIFIVDPAQSSKTKKDVFAEIVWKNGYEKKEVLVVGDDPASEIRAALDLGLPVVMYDALNMHPDETKVSKITNYAELKNYLVI